MTTPRPRHASLPAAPRFQAPRWGRRRLASAMLLAALGTTGVLVLPGCDPRQALYFFQPYDERIAAPGPSLKGKRVVVIAKGVPGSLYDFPTVDRDIAAAVSKILRERIRKIDLVDAQKVYAWDQAHPTWTDPAELAEAFDADMTVYLEVHSFKTQDPSSPGLFEGRSSVHVRVVERAYPKDAKGKPIETEPKVTAVVYEADRDSAFPLRGPVPASAEVTPSAFKARFLELVATELSWHFVGHAPGDDIQKVDFR